MILFTQKDFDVIDQLIREKRPSKPGRFKRTDGQPFGLKAEILVEQVSGVWAEQNQTDMVATLKISGGCHGGLVVNCSSVSQLKQACREAGV